jgi:hypothetical protein
MRGRPDEESFAGKHEVAVNIAIFILAVFAILPFTALWPFGG